MNNIILIIKETIKILKSSYKIGRGKSKLVYLLSLYKNDIGGDTIKVYKCTDCLILHGARAAAYVFNEKKNIECIIVDDNFEKYSQKLKDFLLFHELGHANLHNNLTRKEARKKLKQRIDNNSEVLDIELEADNFAISHLGIDSCIQGLEELKLLVESENSKKEINNRIDHILINRKE